MLESQGTSIDTGAPASRPLRFQRRERTHAGDRRMQRSVSALIDAVNYALAGCHEEAQQSARMAIEAMEAELGAKVPLVPATLGSTAARQGRAGLAPWQVRRVATYMDANLSESIRCEDMARVTRLSISHFMRAFRESFGAPPHAYLMHRRMELAQRLMLTTDTGLRQIALDCGLADQSHLTRLFHRLVGESPAAWRRARIDVGVATRLGAR